MKNPYKALEKALGYSFRRIRHLETALTHPSYRFEMDPLLPDNQRLEFLGDAALGLVAAAALFEAFPESDEGILTNRRSRITSTKALAVIASKLGIGKFLRLGRGEKLTGGEERESNLTDALESILGAAYIDGGLKAVKKIFDKHFTVGLHTEAQHEWMDNPKGALQEWAQRTFRSSPRYRVVHEGGSAHARSYTVQVVVHGKVMGQGSGPNKRAAEAEAAAAALKSINIEQIESAGLKRRMT